MPSCSKIPNREHSVVTITPPLTFAQQCYKHIKVHSKFSLPKHRITKLCFSLIQIFSIPIDVISYFSSCFFLSFFRVLAWEKQVFIML